MKRNWLIILAWLLLLVPTLLSGVGALRLLEHEQERIAGSVAAAATERARSVVETIDLTMTEVKDGLMENLRALPETGLTARLDAWREENPLIRNVFIWDPRRGLVFPPPNQPLSEEETLFLSRFDELFSGRASWSLPAPERGEPGLPTPASSAYSERKELRELAQQKPAFAAEADMAGAPGAPGKQPAPQTVDSGWLPWYSGNRFALLGWVEKADGLRYGVEVEMMALLARLIGLLPSPPPGGETFALIDGSGRIFHQTGEAVLEKDTPRLALVSAGPALPHWSVAVYRSPGAAAESGRGFLVVSSLLVGTFVLSILFGGSLLLWQAYRHQLDARRKTSFVSNVSHELKTPLTTIRLYAELLGEGKIASEEKRRHYLQVIVAESQRLARLVGNVLDFSRLEQGRKQYALEPLDLAEALHALLDTQEIRLGDAGMRLVREIPAGRATTTVDRDAFEQVILNLVDNAIKYAQRGGELEIRLGRDGEACRIMVSDRGPGIPPAHQKRIFEKFHRVDDSLTAGQPGCGLGLSIARKLMVDMGGDLRFFTRAGGGACFEVILACREEKK